MIPVPYDSISLEEIYKRCESDPKTGCINWAAAKTKNRYGQISIDGMVYYVHRVSLAIKTQSDLVGMFACHICDNPSCVNPDHLFVGSHGDNMRDMFSKKGSEILKPAWDSVRGEKNKKAKFTADVAKEIRDRYDAGERPTALAREFGVLPTCVCNIGKRRNWKHI